MDPGNWATEVAGGSAFGYALLSVILLSNVMAIMLQALAVRFGIATGRDLAQACRDHYPPQVALALWFFCALAIIACDLAELSGTALSLNLLFDIPLLWGVCLTAFDVLLLLMLQQCGFRWLEAFVLSLLIIIAACFLGQIALAQPPLTAVAIGFRPTSEIVRDPARLYIAIGILGATVMPHNLYLHSAIVQTRSFEQTEQGKRQAVHFATADSTIALMLALGINAAILIVAAATLHVQGRTDVVVIREAHALLAPKAGPAVGEHDVRAGPPRVRTELGWRKRRAKRSGTRSSVTMRGPGLNHRLKSDLPQTHEQG
jgi:manganese transport protein